MILSGRRVAIVGSREYGWPEAVTRFVDRLPLDCVVVSGACPKGPDRWAVDRAKERGITVKEFPAQWALDGVYNRGAGLQRNKSVAEYSDIVVAFWDGCSRGTADTIKWAHKLGRSLLVIGPDGVLFPAVR